ncbi:hypothetical protein ACFYOT_14805 [Saccharothrix saharensis]|uniref:hypothetical protein n=1 Tax=Saccharothrix saharensis TaxID=571190 RepID=UPI0036AD5958
MAARGEAQADVEVSTLVVPAWRLRWRAPELALVLGERAVALASTRRDEVDRLRAEALVVFASNRMGRGVRIADRAMDALKAAEAASERETAWRLRVELADCARSVGAPLTGFAAVRPVLEADDVPPGLRATALVQAGECLVSVGRGAALAQALDEADHLYQADPLLDHDTTLLHRGLLRASAAGQHRRWGDLPAAVAAARDGLAVLDRLREPASDNGQVRGRLTVELVCALMDLNKPGEASEIGTPLLERPVRAPSAATAGWLRLALATRVHLPAGRVDQARDLLRDAADSAERHQLDTLLAESLLALAHVHEVAGDLAEALSNLRSAHAAERRRARAVYAVRARLAAEFAGIHRRPAGGLHDELAALLRTGTPSPATDPDLAPEVKQQLRQWRPVQMHRNEGVRVKRSRRAAEDMTVDGISAARAHAADRWRLVQPFGETEGDQQPGGRRRAPDQEPRPTQGRPEHARSGQARPITGAPIGTPTSPPSPTQPTPATATPAPTTAATPTGTEPAGGSGDATTPASAHAAGSGSATGVPSGGGVGDVSAGSRVADGSDGVTTPAGTHAGGSGSGTGVSGGGGVEGALAGSHAADGSGDASSSAGTHAGGFGPGTGVSSGGGVGVASAGGHVADGSDGVTTPAGTHVGGFGPVAAAASGGGVEGDVGGSPAGGSGEGTTAGPVHVSGAGSAVEVPGGARVEVGSGGVSAGSPAVGEADDDLSSAGSAGGRADARGSEATPAAGGVGLGDAMSAGARQDASVTSGIEAGSGAEGPAASVGQPGAAAGGHRGSTAWAGDVPAAEAGGPVGGGSGEADAPAAPTGAGERSVPAAGLIAAAGAVRSGRRRAAREAAEEDGERSAGESDSNVLDTLKAAGLLDPQRAGGRRRARDADDEAEAPEPTPQAEPEPVQWRVEPPARLRSENPPPPVDMFDSPTMVQPAIRDDVPPVGLGAAFVKGPLIPTARVPDPPDYPPPPVPDFGIPAQSEPTAERTTPEEPEAVEGRPVFPATDVDSLPEEQAKPLSEPDQVPGVPEPDQVPPVPEPVPADPSPEPTPPPAQFGPTGFLSAADVEHDDTPTTTGPEPTPEPTAESETPSGEVPKEPFVTAVVVGGKTIDLPAVVEPPPPSGDSPSATRASRRHKSDLSLAELLAEALVAYEDARREDEAAGRVEVDEDTVPISPVGTRPPVSDTETTAPIQRVDPPRRFDTWTLPEA